MKVLIAGMTPQSTTAVELIVGTVFPGALFVKQHRGPPTLAELAGAAARCDLCVVDLLGYGLVTWSRDRERELRQAVPDGLCAVLMVPPGTDGARWQDAMNADGGSPGRILLPHPASMALMRAALKTLKDLPPAERPSRLRRAAPAPAPAPVPAAAPAAATRPGVFERAAAMAAGMAAAVAPRITPARDGGAPARAGAGLDITLDIACAPDDPDPPTVPSVAAHRGARAQPAHAVPAAAAAAAKAAEPAPPRPPPEQPRPGERVEPFGLTPAGHAALVAACPEAAANPFLNLVFNVALRPAPHEFRIGSQSGAVFNPAENWVSSSISTALRKRLTQHRMMLQIVEVQALPAHDVMEHARACFGRREDGLRPLDSFVWSLVYNSFEDHPPLIEGALDFRLLRFPNFARLPPVPDLFLQLALLCMRYPQSVQGLRRAYPRQDPRQISLFVLCAVLSGLAEVLPSAPAPDAAKLAPASARPAPKPGFIRSLLAKLF